METIVRMHYGQNSETNDPIYKSVFIPDGRSLLLQNAPTHVQTKNEECFSVQTYLNLLFQERSVALLMLDVPEERYTYSHLDWLMLKEMAKLYLLKCDVQAYIYAEQIIATLHARSVKKYMDERQSRRDNKRNDNLL